MKFPQNDAFLTVRLAHSVEFLTNCLTKVEVDAMTLTPLINEAVELHTAVYLRGTGTPEIKTEEVVDGCHQGTASTPPHVVVELAGLFVTVGDDDLYRRKEVGAVAACRTGCLCPLADVAEDDAVFIRLGRERHWFTQGVDEPLAHVLFHLYAEGHSFHSARKFYANIRILCRFDNDFMNFTYFSIQFLFLVHGLISDFVRNFCNFVTFVSFLTSD